MKIDFTFNETKPSYLKVKKSNHLDKSKKRREFIEVPGRTGDLIIEGGSFENLKITLECYIDVPDSKSIKEVSDELADWLTAPIGYQNLVFNDGCVYRAVCISEISFESNFKKIQDINLMFSAYKE